MPTAHYQPFWPKMRAFALPSYFDGRIRINLIGRERNGLVPLNKYEAYCDEIGNVLNECRNPVSGECAVERIEHSQESDPMARDPSEADMNIVWKGAALAFKHPIHGTIGPVPYFRPGGHTGLFGMAYIAADGIAPGDRGKRSSFDVVPTLFDLLGERLPENISGRSLLALH
jgi:predicted AlkP superfamily phosphohydrolase/phosphomutase